MEATASKVRPWLIALACLAWVAISIGLYWKQYPYSPSILPLIPLGLIMLVMAVWHFEGFLFAMVCLVPMSVGFTDLGGGLGAALPGEAMLLLAAAGVGLMILRGQIRLGPLLFHPIGIVILLQMLWSTISLLTSSHPEQSLKFLVARSTYIIVYYIGFGTLFLQPERIVAFFKAYLWGLIPVMLWAIVHLAQYGLSRKFSPVMAEPFYDDHTIFGACLAMMLPLAGWVALRDKLVLRWNRPYNLAWPAVVLVAISLILTFSRAAVISMGVIVGFYLVMRLRIRFRFFVVALFLVMGIGWVNRAAIVERFEHNEHVSGEDVLATAASVTNVNTDDSNKERLNRWACAMRMFEARPWLGFGPGTYEREYGNFQVLNEMTRISTWAGDRGDAHSEYLGALSEQGIPGLIFLGGLFLMSIRVGMKVVYTAADRLRRSLAMAIVLALSTYYFHGLVNDFLDLDKAAVLFWGMLGMLAALDRESAASGI